jgi:hypothetical protein
MKRDDWLILISLVWFVGLCGAAAWVLTTRLKQPGKSERALLDGRCASAKSLQKISGVFSSAGACYRC